jgi:hypothetical protein
MFTGNGECESVEQVMRELIALAHLRPKKFVAARPIVMPHDFRGFLPFSNRWAAWSMPPDFSFLGYATGDPIKSAAWFSELASASDSGVRQSMLIPILDDGKAASLGFHRIREINKDSHSARRETLPVKCDRLFEYRLGAFEPGTSRWLATGCHIAQHEGALFYAHRGRKSAEVSGSVLDAAGASLSAAMSLRYEWQLSIGSEGCPSAAFVVERNALPSFVKIRDIADGKRRRDALLHFVCEHSRRKPRASEDERPDVFVRKHLRGEHVFRWDGFVFEIKPPKFDAEVLRP